MKVSGFAWAGGLLLGCSLLAPNALAETASRTVNLTVRDATGTPRSDVSVYYTDADGVVTKADVQGSNTFLANLGEKVTLIFESEFGSQSVDVLLPETTKIDLSAVLDGANLSTKLVSLGELEGEGAPDMSPARLTTGYMLAASAGPGANSCGSAAVIVGSGSFPYNTNGATTDGVGHAACLFFGNNNTFRDVWFRWTADCTGTATINTCGSLGDSKINVYNGGAACPPGDADLITCNDDFCGLLSQVTFPTTNGSTYLIRVGNFGATGTASSGTLSVTCGGGGGGGFSCTSGVGCQLPDQQGQGGGGTLAATSDLEAGFRVAEKIKATAGGSITSLCWWGGYFNFGGGFDCGGSGAGLADSFQVTYFNDDSITGTVPGTLRAGPFAVSPTKALTGNNYIGILNEWGFEASHAAVPVAANECVWIEIVNDPAGTGCFWLWGTAPPGDGRSAQAAPAYAGTDFDLALCVDIATDPAGCPPPPAGNDTCATADPITGTGTFPFDNSGASTDGPSHAACNFFSQTGIDRDLWYCWTAPCSGDVVIETCGLTTVDTKIAVYNGCACPATDANLLACNDDACGLQTRVNFTAVAGNQYLIRLGTFPGAAGGSGAFSISCVVLPDNDACANATPVAIPSTTAGSTTLATADPSAPFCGTSVSAAGVWYSVVGTGNTITASLCNGNTNYDAKLNVYCGDCAALTCVTGNDDFCGLQSQVSWCSQAGATYKILVQGFGGATGNFELVLSDNGTPCTGAVSCLTTGACCIGPAQDTCIVTTEADCLAAGGVYVGDNSVCSGLQVGSCSSAFEDIAGSGTQLPLGDDSGQVVPLGFSFDFFGSTKTTIAVCSNGYLTFGATLTDFSNDPIPSTLQPNDLIAPLWDDLNPAAGGTVHHQTLGLAPNRRFIAQWTNVPQFNMGDSNTFQAVLYETSNRIEFRYGVITPEAFAGDYSIGIENATGTVGYSVPGSSVGAGDCVEFAEITGPCPPPECHLVFGSGQTAGDFTRLGYTFTTQVSEIFEYHDVWLDSGPEFMLPGFVSNGNGVPSQRRRVSGGAMQAIVPVLEFNAQILMWNPQVFPSNPEQHSEALAVTVWSNGEVTVVNYGTRDGITLGHEIVEHANGLKSLRFPFSIDGL